MPLLPPQEGALLPPYRVLDLSGPEGVYCGKLLADYGADVVRVEPPSGDPGRSLGPFSDDSAHPERSLYFLFYNTNKRSITLDLKSERGRDLMLRLAAQSDVVLESFPILDYGWNAADWHARERARLVSAGRTPPFVDGQIAAIAHANGLVLVTSNTKDFRAFDGLRVESWM